MALMFCAASWACVKPQPAGPPVAGTAGATAPDATPHATPHAAEATEAAPVRFEYRQVVMGVEARLLLYAADEPAARAAAGAAFAEMARLDALLSDWREDSELSRLGRAGAGVHEVSPELGEVLEAALSVSRATDGAFDVTAGPLVRLWREARRRGAPPDDAALEAARARVGWRRLRAAGTRVEVDGDGLQLDLGGIAKGYACDRALSVLRAHGCGRALVGLGGDLVAGDPPPGAEGWDVRAGCGAAGRPPRRWLLRDAAVATSGDASQVLVHDGVRYSHVIDPRTGRALNSGGCATVLAARGMSADAWATALGVAGAPAADAALAEGRVLEACLDLPPAAHEPDATSSAPWLDLLADDALDAFYAVEGDGPRAPDGWRVERGVLAVPSAPPGGYLATTRSFRDLRLALDFRLAPMANGGLFLRGLPGGGDPAYSGCEIQLLDDVLWPWVTDSTLQPWQLAASLYGAVPAGERRVMYGGGRWNSLDVLYQGSRLAVALNGVLLFDVDTLTLDARPPFAERAPEGFVGLQRYASPHVPGDTAVWIRHLVVQEL